MNSQEQWQRWCSKIKTINRKYIVIISTFALITVASFMLPIPIVQLFTTPVCLLLTGYLLQDIFVTHMQTFKKEYIHLIIIRILPIALISQAALNLFSHFTIQPNVVPTNTLFLPIIPVLTTVSAPVLEEIIFRHIIYRTLQGNKQNFSIIASTTSSLLFATMHMSTIGFLGYFAIGMIFCYYYHSTRNIYTTIIAHMIFNLLSVFGTSIHMVFGGQQ